MLSFGGHVFAESGNRASFALSRTVLFPSFGKQHKPFVKKI